MKLSKKFIAIPALALAAGIGGCAVLPGGRWCDCFHCMHLRCYRG